MTSNTQQMIEAALSRFEAYMALNAEQAEEARTLGREAYNNMKAAAAEVQENPYLFCTAVLRDSYRDSARMYAREIRELRRLRAMAAEKMVDLMLALHEPQIVQPLETVSCSS